MLLLRKIYSVYNSWFHEDLDPRTKDWFLSGSPLPILAIVSLYLYVVNGNGQRWMKARQPFKLTKLINAYNALQVVCNAYCCLTGAIYGHRLENWKFFCIPEPKNDFTTVGNLLVETSYYFYLLKVIDLMDTIFFILRKKNGQVSFLHIYHHAGMTLASYLYFKLYSGGGYGTVFGILNGFVHVVMYSYYFLTSYKPELKKSFWWKKHITQIQLIQFLLLFIYGSCAAFSGCNNRSKIFLCLSLPQSLVMIVMFSDFYYKAYLKKKTLT